MLRVCGLCLATGFLFASCTSVPAPKEGGVTERYTFAQALVDNEDYDRAIVELESLMFDTRATTLEDDVLFMLAGAYYDSKQYLLAIDIYRRLLEQTPDSPYAPDAQFQLAKSHKQLSPAFSRDQEHTRKAIREFLLYMEMYPVKSAAELQDDIKLYTELSRINPDKEEYKRNLAWSRSQYERIDKITECASSIAELREKLAHHDFSIAQQYRKLKKYKGAIAYYDLVIRFYPDTVYQDKAWLGKIDVLIRYDRWFEAQSALDAYDQQFPENLDKVEGYREKITKHFENS